MSLKDYQYQFFKNFSTHDIDILKDMCNAAGLHSSGRLPRDRIYESVLYLELIFRNIDDLQAVSMFFNLTQFTVVGSEINSLKGIDSLTNLTELWVVECKIAEINYLTSSFKLRKLYLYSNHIQKIDGLQNCQHLEVLWLAENQISKIEGLEKLTNLKELNLASNRIRLVGNSLQKNVRLENLNLTGNKLYFFRDLLSLMNLPKLKILAFADPQYNPCPLYKLCNYTTCIIYHFTKLSKLDGKLLLEDDIRKELELICMKKLYYFMQMHMLNKKKAEALRKLELSFEILQDQYLMTTKKIIFNIKEKERIQCLIDDLTSKTTLSEEAISLILTNNNERNTRSLEKSKNLEISKLMYILDQLEKRNERYSECYNYALIEVKEEFKTETQFMFLEHETLGTVKYSVGKPLDIWYKACEDILLSRFCLNHYRRHNVCGIKMKRCIKVINESLLMRFQEKTHKKKSLSESLKPHDDYDYLFLIKNEFQDYSGKDKLMKMLEFSIQLIGTEHSKYPSSVMLANSLYHADKQRFCLNENNKESIEKEGIVLLMRTCIGQSSKVVSQSPVISQEFFPGFDSVKKSLASDYIHLKSDGQPLVSCSCDLKSYEYHIFDPDVVLPEFVIEFEYMTEDVVKIDATLEKPWEVDNYFAMIDDKKIDYEELQNLQDLPSNAEAITVTWDDIIQMTCSATLTHLEELNLHGYQIKELPPLSPLDALKKLILTFNCLRNLNGISYLANLELLDVSFNNLVTLDGLQGLWKLEKLDISFNKISDILPIIKCLDINAPNIAYLNIHHNSLSKENEFIPLLQKKLHKLKYLNDANIYNFKVENKKNVERKFQVEYGFIIPHASTMRRPPPCLCLKNMTYKMLNLFPKATMPDITSPWHLKITTLELSSLSISRLPGIGKLENLKWACFSCNNISSLEDLAECTRMEELYLDHNTVTTLCDIGNMKDLVRINVDHNQLKTLDGGCFTSLKSLQSLIANFNQISSLKGLDCCPSLTELYMIDNNISELNALSVLKNLKFLLVLMLCGNPVTRYHNDYRYTVLFNVPKLLGLDGALVSREDVIASKELLGGRLTMEFLHEHMNITDLSSLTFLELSNCSLLSVNLGNGSELPNLTSINLEHNQLTNFSGLIHLCTIKTLCLNFNHIETIFPPNLSNDCEINDLQISNSLEVLHLGYNDIWHIETLQLKYFSALKSLFLHGNKIKSLTGLEDLWYLEHLVLDRNLISVLQKGELESLCWLQELHIQENRLKEIPLLSGPLGLRKLFLGFNRINDLEELFKLTKLSCLEEISFAGNPVTRRALHRSILIHFNSALTIIDGIKVSGEERLKANRYFCEGIYVSNESIGPSSPIAGDSTQTTSKASDITITSARSKPLKPILHSFVPLQMEGSSNTSLQYSSSKEK